MKTLWISLIAFSAAQAAWAQPETFDAATFVAPAGWKRAEINGAISLQGSKTRAGRVSMCDILIFPSRETGDSPEENFRTEWDRRIARALGVTQRPMPKPSPIPEGWTALTASADIVRQGVQIRNILTVSTGSGKSMSVLVSFAGDAPQSELQAFFASLKFRANESAPPVVSQRTEAPAAGGPLGNYVYTPPQGWTRQEARDRIVLTSPAYSNGERCQINMMAMRTSNGDLGNEAIAAFQQIFRADPRGNGYPQPKLIRGLSPQGWEYFMAKRTIGNNDSEIGVSLLAARVNGQTAVIWTTAKRPLVSNCFGELVRDQWPDFFYSLKFRNAAPSGKEEAAIKQRLAGAWIMATGSVGLRYQFDANGRYLGAGSAQQRTLISSTEVLATTQTYFGDGSYSFDGNTMVMTGDDGRRSARLFRLEQVSTDSGRTWADTMCLLDPGASGEVCYKRTQ